MNINTVNNSALQQVQNKKTLPNNQMAIAKQTSGLQTDKVNLSDSSKIRSQLDALPKEQQQEIKNYMKALDEQSGQTKLNKSAQYSDAPQALKDIASTLKMNTKQLMDKMPDDFGNKLASKQQNNSAAMSTYSKVAA